MRGCGQPEFIVSTLTPIIRSVDGTARQDRQRTTEILGESDSQARSGKAPGRPLWAAGGPGTLGGISSGSRVRRVGQRGIVCRRYTGAEVRPRRGKPGADTRGNGRDEAAGHGSHAGRGAGTFRSSPGPAQHVSHYRATDRACISRETIRRITDASDRR
jgi:hypothetical protein